jgi:hypothetical protein
MAGETWDCVPAGHVTTADVLAAPAQAQIDSETLNWISNPPVVGRDGQFVQLPDGEIMRHASAFHFRLLQNDFSDIIAAGDPPAHQ